VVSGRPPGDPDGYDRISSDFDDVERVTTAVKRGLVALAVAAPLWLLLLWLFARLFGVSLGGFVLASLISLGVAWWWRSRNGGLFGDATPRGGPAPPLGIPRVAIVVAVAILLGYAALVLMLAGR